MQDISVFAESSGFATSHQASLIRYRGLFNGTTATAFLMFFDASVYNVPANGTAPTIPAIPLYAGSAGNPTAFFQEYEIGYFEAVNGIYWAVSTTQETLTLSADTVDISIEISDIEMPPAGQTAHRGDLVNGIDALTVYANLVNSRLLSFVAKNISAGTLYLRLDSKPAPNATLPPFMEWTVPAGTNIYQFFGQQGLYLPQGPSGSQTSGCALLGSTTPKIYTPSTGGSWNIEAEYWFFAAG